ncbi:MAG TPA: beta-propeller domain-containing protein, partial [Iamia sp.]
MTNASMTPGSRPRRGVIGVLALLGAGALTTGLVLAAGEASDPPQLAGAVELATFSSCEDLAAWGAEAMGDIGAGGDDAAMEQFNAVGGEVADDSDAASGAPTASASSGSSQGELSAEREEPAAPATTTAASPDEAEAEDGERADADEPADDETNVAVEGVDEIDLIDRLTEDVVLVASATRLAVVDLVAGEVIDATNVSWDAQITYDAENGVAWVVGHPDSGGLAVERYAVDTDGLGSQGRWTTPGYLVDARRVGDELHVVASDGFVAEPFVAEGDVPGTVVPDVPAADPEGGGTVPFEDGPVPCDEVLHPVGPSDPTATLLVTLPATGTVEPVRATEVVGSGSLVHVTTGSIYLATPQWATDTATTGIHRFDLATLQPTGSGSVEGTLLDEFSMSEHDGVLRVAVTQPGGGFGRPIPVEPGA